MLGLGGLQERADCHPPSKLNPLLDLPLEAGKNRKIWNRSLVGFFIFPITKHEGHDSSFSVMDSFGWKHLVEPAFTP